MSESFPPLPPELIDFAHGGQSLLVGTCSRTLEPHPMRALGLRVVSGGFKATAYLPTVTATQTVANLRENPRIAVTVSSVTTFKTMQLKGAATDLREGNAEDIAYAIAYRRKFADELNIVGMSERNTMRLATAPLVVVDFEIAVVYSQTPGPVAGRQMPLAGTRL